MDSLRVLVISDIEWSDENAFGNTLSNWFGGAGEIQTASIYTRSTKPNNEVCNSYYSISFQSILRNFFHPDNIGDRFTAIKKSPEGNKQNLEKKIIEIIHKYSIKPVYAIDNQLFRTRKWANKRFKDFILQFNPDAVFYFVKKMVKPYIILDEISNLCPNIKHIGFIADDVYGRANAKQRKIIQDEIMRADLLFGASKLLCENYHKMFQKQIHPLYKGCHIGQAVEKSFDPQQIDIVYAGNLYYGRTETLSLLASEIVKYNDAHDAHFRLKIYSGNTLDKKYRNILDDGKNTFFLGKLPFNDVKNELSKASIVLHVESFESKWNKVVRYSFSTKIIDCLESGSVLLAIGSAGLASIEQTKEIPGTFCVTEPQGIYSCLETIAESNLSRHAKELTEYSKEHYNSENIRAQLLDLMTRACEE